MYHQECAVEEIEEDEPPSKSSKDKKSKVEEKPPSLVFKITSKVAYKTVLKGNSWLKISFWSCLLCRHIFSKMHANADLKFKVLLQLIALFC